MAQSRTALLFSGQGQLDPQFTDQLGAAPSAAHILEEAQAAWVREGEDPSLLSLGEGIAAVGTGDDSFQAVVTVAQVRLFLTGVLAFDLLRYRGTRADVLIGHSLGEIAALCAAGALSVGDATRAVILRTRALFAYHKDGHGLLALSAGEERARMLQQLAGAEQTALACLNSPQDVVLSGPDAELAEVARIAGQWDVSSIRLNAPFAFHHPANDAAASVLRETLKGLTAKPVGTPVYSPIAEAWIEEGKDLADLLATHLVCPVRFADAVRHVHDRGVGRFIECGSGDVLVKIVSRTVSGAEVLAPLHGPSRRPADTCTEQTSAATEPGLTSPHTPSTATEPPADTERDAHDLGAATTQGANLEDEVRELYATSLGYPVEVFEDDAELEADLGIDSLKRTELLAKVAQHYRIPLNTTKAATLYTIADVIVDVRSQLESK
ncbi:acyltransferase domain-containing protein [Streptomyces nigra]|uniref:acyltransferase domain-containing protein n=1 Tax=Streptomyces nigra TaxID=1827580 RepID=UPI00364A61AD